MKSHLYIKHLFGDKRTYLLYLLILLYALNNLFRPLDTDGISLFFDIHENIFSISTVTFLLIPLFLLLIEHNAVLFDHHCIILKMNKKKTWWRSRITYLGIDIGIFTLFTNGLVLLFSFILEQPDWQFSTFKSIFLSIVLQFLGYASLAVLFTAGKVLTRKTYIGFITAYAIIVLDFLFLQLSLSINILSNSMFILINGNIIWLARFFYLLSLFIVITVGSYLLVKDIDFL